MDHIDGTPFQRAEGQTKRGEPCWVEEQRHTDGLSYGRSRCFNDQLADMEARAAAGEFDTHSPG
jgi:hypothetical protein